MQELTAHGSIRCCRVSNTKRTPSGYEFSLVFIIWNCHCAYYISCACVECIYSNSCFVMMMLSYHKCVSVSLYRFQSIHLLVFLALVLYIIHILTQSMHSASNVILFALFTNLKGIMRYRFQYNENSYDKYYVAHSHLASGNVCVCIFCRFNSSNFTARIHYTYGIFAWRATA